MSQEVDSQLGQGSSYSDQSILLDNHPPISANTFVTTSIERRCVHQLSLARVFAFTAHLATYVLLTAAVYTETQSGIWTSLVLLAWYGSGALSSLLGGWLADRWQPERLMILSDVLGAICLGLVLLCSAPWHFLLWALLAAGVEALFYPASQAWVQVSLSHHTWANSRLGAARNLGYLIGPVSAGILVASVGLTGTWLIMGGCLLLSALCISLMPTSTIQLSFKPPLKTEHISPKALVYQNKFVFLFKEQKAIFHQISEDKVLFYSFLAACCVMASYGLMIPGEVALAEVFKVGLVGYGILVAAWGLGSIGGALWAGKIKPGNYVNALKVSCGVVAIFFLLAGVSPWFWLAVVSMLAAGVAGAYATVAWESLRISRSDPEFAGRTSGLTHGILQACFAAPIVLGGFCIDIFGVRTLYVLSAFICFLAYIWLLKAKKIEATPTRFMRDLA